VAILVKSDVIERVGLSDRMRSQIHHACTARHNARVRMRVRKAVAAEIVLLESRLSDLRRWMHENKKL